MKRLAACLVVAACAGAPARPDVPKGVVVLRTNIRDASLWIDDEMVGELRELPGGVRLRAGVHRIELRHDRYHTRYLEVTVAGGDRQVVEMPMVEQFP